MLKVFANNLGDRDLIPDPVISKTQRIVHYKVWIKGKWNNPEKEVAPSPYTSML